jgi:tyrosinase
MVSRRGFITGASAAGLGAHFILGSPAHAAAPRLRRDVMELADNDPFFGKYAAAVSAMHQLPESDGRNWRRQAKIHADFCKHGRLSFLHWHRHYLAFFETICGELIGDPDFAMPYWNWSKKGGVIPAPFFDTAALNVEHWNDPGVYSSPNWGSVDTVGKRGLVKGQGLLDDPQRGGSFTLDTINAIKKMPTAALFRARLEGSPHNDGHVVAGATASGKTGHIGDGLSPLDPIFWLHHCMVDRLWAEWQQSGNTTPDPGESYAGNFVDKSGAPAAAAAGGALQIAALGYTYDVLQTAGLTSSAPANGGLLNSIVPDLERALQAPTAPVRLGSGTGSGVSMPLVETALKVATPGLLGALASDRPFRQFSVTKQASVNLEGRRILASFTGVMPPEGKGDLVVNVFVNCPYLSPSTRYVDPHYAGTFSFFGRMNHDPNGTDFVIDITSPVRNLVNEGRIKEEELTVQLMPLPAHMNGRSESKFQAGRVEIITV